MIEIKGLCHCYERSASRVIDNISLGILDGEYAAVIGPNGSGKTTLLRHLNGLLRPAHGRVLVDGLDTGDPKALPEIRRLLGMVFQNPDNQLVGMTVEEDVAFGPGNLGLPSKEIRRRVSLALEAVGLEGFSRREPYSLSSGEKQLVAIAGVLAMEPRHIALDEPTAYLAPAARTRVLEVMGKLNQEGITIIHATHEMSEAAPADHLVVMDKGRLVMEDKPARIFQRAEELEGLGLDLPPAAELMRRLKRGGVNVPEDVMTIDQACNLLLEMLDERRSGTTMGAPRAEATSGVDSSVCEAFPPRRFNRSS